MAEKLMKVNILRLNLANCLTTLRILGTPLCILFIMWEIPYNELIALGIFILAALTDALDGYIARVRNEISDFGKFYDPLADKVLVIFVLIGLAMKIGEAWCWWAVGIICLREIFVALMRRRLTPAGVTVDANNYGKLKTFIQCVAVGGLILKAPAAPYLLWASVIFTVFSGIYYINTWRIRPNHIPARNPALGDDVIEDGSSAYN